MMKCHVILIALLATGCATSPGPTTGDRGNEQIGRYSVIHRGPELEVSVGFSQGGRSIGEEWLIIAVEFMTPPRSDLTTVNRSDITAITPDGRRLALVSQNEYRGSFNTFRIRLERAMEILPIFGRYETAVSPCNRWFLEGPFGGVAVDEITVNTFQVCSGPLVFKVSGGVQPGRWRLIIDLEESRVDIPFELYADE